MSDAIIVCLKDLELCEKHPDYTIDMGRWHEGHGDRSDSCSVCLGGARLARIYNDPARTISMYFDYVPDKIEAMDDVRSGNLVDAVIKFYHYTNVYIGEEAISNIKDIMEEWSDKGWDKDAYDVDPKAFKRTMRKVATRFRRIGL